MFMTSRIDCICKLSFISFGFVPFSSSDTINALRIVFVVMPFGSPHTLVMLRIVLCTLCIVNGFPYEFRNSSRSFSSLHSGSLPISICDSIHDTHWSESGYFFLSIVAVFCFHCIDVLEAESCQHCKDGNQFIYAILHTVFCNAKRKQRFQLFR